jgi:hypothetical protein
MTLLIGFRALFFRIIYFIFPYLFFVVPGLRRPQRKLMSLYTDFICLQPAALFARVTHTHNHQAPDGPRATGGFHFPYAIVS